MKSRRNYLRLQKGFTLIEYMVSLIVLSIGLLGVAGMQSLGLRLNYDALQRSQATILAYSIAEKMRLDPVNALLVTGTNPYEGTFFAASGGATCNNASVAANDVLVCWQVALRDRLPNGSITITGPPSTTDPTLTLNLSWSENWIQQGATSVETSFQTFSFQIFDGS